MSVLTGARWDFSNQLEIAFDTDTAEVMDKVVYYHDGESMENITLLGAGMVAHLLEDKCDILMDEWSVQEYMLDAGYKVANTVNGIHLFAVASYSPLLTKKHPFDTGM